MFCKNILFYVFKKRVLKYVVGVLSVILCFGFVVAFYTSVPPNSTFKLLSKINDPIKKAMNPLWNYNVAIKRAYL